jgi:hypothetical protein
MPEKSWNRSTETEAVGPRQTQALKLEEALVFLEQAIRKAGGDEAERMLLTLPVVEALQGRGAFGRTVSTGGANEASVAVLFNLIMSMVRFKEFSGLVLMDSPEAVTRCLVERIAGSRLTASGLAVQCGKKLADADELLGREQVESPYQLLESAASNYDRQSFKAFVDTLIDPDTIVVTHDKTFKRANVYGLTDWALKKVNCLVRVQRRAVWIADVASAVSLV